MPNFNIALIFFVGLELCYYLLIAQTGIVEVFHSNLFLIGFLPFGGVIGSYLSSHIDCKNKYKVIALLSLQAVLTFFYPNLNELTLFLLGLAVGGMAPLMIQTLKQAKSLDFIFALSIAYTVGTLLFTSDPNGRGTLGIVLSVTALLAYLFIDKIKVATPLKEEKPFIKYSLVFMVFWVFLDSALFETLSRDIVIPIWRDGYTVQIISFHILGVIAGVIATQDHFQKSLTILILFALSYLFYFLREPLLLSIVYPFVISYYNVAILQSLVTFKTLKSIGIAMIFIGWIASGLGLFVALEQFIIYIPLLFLVIFLYMINQQTNYNYTKKEAYHG